MTNQRLKIIEHLKSVHTHPTAEMVYKEVKKELPAITLATVYRNLNLLTEQHKILRLEINSEYRFDGDITCHQHCFCDKCKNFSDLFQEEISKYALNKIKTNKFKADSVNILFNGICKNCMRG